MDNKSNAVLITGVSGGVGFVTAQRFIEQGYQVIGLDINEPKESLEELTFIKTDITKIEEVINAFNYVKGLGITLKNIISTAGIYNLDSLVEISEEEFIRIFDINVFSIYRINKTFLPLLEKGGKIIMISSELAPLDPLPFTGLYAITKSTIEKYAYSLRMELQLLGYQVVLIRPGAIDTGLIDVSQKKLDKFVFNTNLYQTNSQRFVTLLLNGCGGSAHVLAGVARRLARAVGDGLPSLSIALLGALGRVVSALSCRLASAKEGIACALC